MARHGENIRKRKDGRWEGRYIESYSNNGKAYYRSIYGTTYTEVREKLTSNKNLELQSVICKTDIETLCQEWLVFKKDSVKLSTYTKYRNCIKKHIIPYFKNMKAVYLTSQHVKDFMLEKAYLSHKTQHDLLSQLIQILKYGQSQNYIGFFDFNYLKYPKIIKSDLPTLKSTEVTKLVRYLQSIHEVQKIGVFLSLFMGIRLGELCALQWKDINFYTETIHIDKTMQRLTDFSEGSHAKTKIVIDVPKSQKSIRVIPIPSFLLELLKEFMKYGNAYVLTGTVEYIEPRTYQNIFKRYLKKCKIDDINFHALRHTFATRAIEQGCDIKSLSEILGHSSVKFTLERYVHPSDEHKKMNLEKLAIFY
ncbi:MAG: site-specific integrase [Ruminococcus sp.]|nr:site-specific integrase [Ruminococcus sp.]